MSTAATPAAPQAKTGNTFQFVNHSGHTKINYDLEPNGPPRAGHPPEAPTLFYDGPEGQLSFSGSEISQEDAPMGTLVTVVLKPQSDAGATSFSLFLPPVTMGDGTSETFTTYGVKTYQPGSFQRPGAQLTYEVERFTGTAQLITIHAL